MIRLIVSDIDSTLIDQGHLPPQNIAALAEAAAQGVRVALATIRKLDSTRQISNRLGMPCALLCNGGATIYDADGSALHTLSIPLGLARTMVALADEQQLPLLATIDEVNYYRPHSHPPSHLDAPGHDLDPLLPALTRAPSRLLVRGEAGATLLMRTFADAPLRFVRHYTPDGILADATITHINATKEAALELLCRHWAIDLAEVLALGDAEADIGMIERAGVGVAVGNAHPSVRAAADWVAPTAGEGGVAAAIRRFVLGSR